MILIAGDVMLDHYVMGEVARISPEAPVPVVHGLSHEYKAGGAANVSLNVRQLGFPCSLLGKVGSDEGGHRLKQILHEKNVQCYWSTISGMATTVKTRIISRNQQLLRLDFEEKWDATSFDAQALQAWSLHKGSVAIFSDYAKGAWTFQAMKAYLGSHMIYLVDPKSHDFSIYQGADILTPNLKEFIQVVGPVSDHDDLVRKGQALRHAMGLKALVVTQGANGVTSITADEVIHMPALQADSVCDVTGAGDTFIAVLACAIHSGLAILESVQLANIAAGLVVRKLGTSAMTRDEISRFLNQTSPECLHLLCPMKNALHAFFEDVCD